MTERKILLQLDSVTKIFKAEDKREVIALENTTLNCRENEFLCVLGPTGCGKTTLLRLLAGLEQPTTGSVTIHSNQIGFVFQQNTLFPWRTVIDNIMFGLEVRGWGYSERKKRASEVLQLVRLNGVEKAYPYELSGGMQQRISIARALAYSPEILMMDEPFGSLDERTRYILQSELLEIQRQNKMTVIFVTHNIEEAIFLAERLLIVGGAPGQIVKELSIDMPHPRDRISKSFISYLLDVRQVFEKLVLLPF